MKREDNSSNFNGVFSIKAILKDKEGKSKGDKARVGVLRTKSGVVETPVFLPVATKAAAKFLSSEQLKGIGAKAIISNAFLLYLRPGVDLIKRIGGIHKFMNYNGVIFTDCGGFQKLRSMFLRIDNSGIHFKSPFDGSKHLISPKSIVKIQNDLGSDVGMSLDECVPYGTNELITAKAMKRTHSWAKESLEELVRMIDEGLIKENKRMLLFGISQGGFSEKLRAESNKFISGLRVKDIGFDGIAIGGLRIGEPIDIMLRMLRISVENIDFERPHYLMGVGNPADIVKAVELGIDIFDSIYPVENARHGNLFTWQGKIDIEKTRFKDDFNPIDKGCDCFVCKNYTRAYLHHLFKTHEPLAQMLAVYHNQHFMQELMKRIRRSISEGWFYELRDKIVELYKTP